MAKHAMAIAFTSLTLVLAAALLHAASTQYMAVCTERQEHGGQEFGLTSWVGSFDEANNAGKTHEQRTKGHRWRVAQRDMP